MKESTPSAREEGHRIFEATMARAQQLLNRGVDATAIAAGLLAVVTEITSAAIGPAETARMLRTAALALDDDSTRQQH